MGTRSLLQFNSKEIDLSITLYKHWDGYPSDTLNMLLEAVKKSDSMESLLDQCAAYYSSETSSRTFDSMLEDCGPFTDLCMCNNQWDIEYYYYIDVDNKTVDVYGGHGCQIPSDHFRAGRSLPSIEVDSYYPEYRPKYLQYINESLLGLAACGWIVNPYKKTDGAAPNNSATIAENAANDYIVSKGV